MQILWTQRPTIRTGPGLTVREIRQETPVGSFEFLLLEGSRYPDQRERFDIYRDFGIVESER